MPFSNAHTLRPTDLGLILSYQCTAACAHCLYNCGPSWHDWMTPDGVFDALSAAKNQWGNGFQVHLTGGEAFLNFPLLLHAVQIAADLTIPVYVETNASWCREGAMTEERFRRLKQSGLSAVLISVSPFHQTSIPLKRTLTAIRVATKTFGEHRVMIYQSAWLPAMMGFGLEEPVPLSRWIQSYGAQLWAGYGLISGGRAGHELGHLQQKRSPSAFKGLTCRAELAHAPHSHFDLYGHFIPGFCSGISLGDWHDLAKLRTDFEAKAVDPLILTLLEQGPYGLYQQAVEAEGYMALSEGYAGKCHLCVDVRRHWHQRHPDRQHLRPEHFYKIF
jgi:hypothetical protein